MVATHNTEIKHSMLCVTGVYLNLSRLSVCSSCKRLSQIFPLDINDSFLKAKQVSMSRLALTTLNNKGSLTSILLTQISIIVCIYTFVL